MEIAFPLEEEKKKISFSSKEEKRKRGKGISFSSKLLLKGGLALTENSKGAELLLWLTAVVNPTWGLLPVRVELLESSPCQGGCCQCCRREFYYLQSTSSGAASV